MIAGCAPASPLPSEPSPSMEARVERARKCIRSHKFGHSLNPNLNPKPLCSRYHRLDPIPLNPSPDNGVSAENPDSRWPYAPNRSSCTLRPVFLKHLFLQIDSSWKNLIFTRTPSPNVTSLHTLFAPFQSISKPDPSSLTDRNPNPNLQHFTPRTRSSLRGKLNPIPRFSISALYCNSWISTTCFDFSCLRLFSTSVERFRRRSNCSPRATGGSFVPNVLNIDPDALSEIVELIRRDSNSMESELDKISLRISHAVVGKILRALNDRGVSALRFFNWVLSSHSGFRPNSEIYNQVIDNIGRLGDYKTMLLMLNELSSKGYCLTEKAFTFLTVCGSATLKDSIRSVAETLNIVGVSCRGSGIHSLIKLLCAMQSFDLAIFVMDETARRTSYYNVLIAAKCRNGDFQGARDLFDEMRRFGCDPNIKSYNYLLGSLFKNKRVVEACDLIQTMEALGYLPDLVTFEVVAYHACKANRMDFAIEFLSRMLSEGLKPRTTMHAAFIKGYFWSGRVEDAYKYVLDMSTKDRWSGNMNYSLLASLFRISGRVVEASRVLQEMMEKGLRPNFPVYMRVMKDLYKINRGDLTLELKSMFSTFNTTADSE